MRVAVAGLWHLGTVTAACCASGGHAVVAFEESSAAAAALEQGVLPVEEPGLAALVADGRRDGLLRFTSSPADLSQSDLLWVCYDTPVDENDAADVEYVFARLAALLPHLSPHALVLISSQLPVGSTRRLEKMFPRFEFAYSPENLRLGKAIEVFRNPDRVVAGVRHEQTKERILLLFLPFTNRLEWMTVESAEMTKHAINSFLATSVAFINEVATLCEETGADAQEVERGLKTDIRIGANAYLHPGGAFAGGTLARDISFLLTIGQSHGVPAHLLRGVLESNSAHKFWLQRRLLEAVPDLKGKTIGVLGLTYKPGTNTLRRSTSVEVCRWIAEQGAAVRAFDPAVQNIPEELAGFIQLMKTAGSVFEGADAVIIATPWPEFRSVSAAADLHGMRQNIVLDPARFLESLFRQDESIEYLAIGVGK